MSSEETMAEAKPAAAPEVEETPSGPQFQGVMAKSLFGFLFDEEIEDDEEDLEETQGKAGATNKTLKQKQQKIKMTRRALLRKRVGDTFLKVHVYYSGPNYLFMYFNRDVPHMFSM